MSAKKGPEEDKEAQKPASQGKGVDDDLLFVFNNLVEQNAELSGMLEDISALKQLAESTLTEAQQAAEIINEEAERKAKEEASVIIAKAEKEARAAAEDVVAKAREKAEAEARDIVAETRKRSEAAEREAREIMRAADDKSAGVKKRAEEEAAKIIAEARKRAEEEARAIRQAAAEMLRASGGTGEGEAKVREEKASLAEGAGIQTEKQSPSTEERAGTEPEVIYADTVDLVVVPPLTLPQLQKLRKHLKEVSQVRILGLKGSLDSGINMKLMLQAAMPLMAILANFPEVHKVSDKHVEAGAKPDNGEKVEEETAKSIIVTLNR